MPLHAGCSPSPMVHCISDSCCGRACSSAGPCRLDCLVDQPRMLRTVLEVLPCCPVSVQRQLVALLPEICLEDDYRVKPLRCDQYFACLLARLHASTMGAVVACCSVKVQRHSMAGAPAWTVRREVTGCVPQLMTVGVMMCSMPAICARNA